MISKRFLTPLLAAVLGLPILILVCQGLGRLLAAMNDEGGATLLRRVAQLGVAAWVLALIGTVVVLAVERASEAAAEPADLDELGADELERQ